MTQKEYIEKHIPHRINLLITFRERYGNSPTLQAEAFRDFYRCSKDISMLMVRFLLGEMGIIFKIASSNANDDISSNWKPKFNVKQLTEAEVKNDSRYRSLKIVLKAANRAVAHIEANDIDHHIKLDSDLQILFDAINFTEEKVIEKIYLGDMADYQRVMCLSENDMKRNNMS